MYSKANRRFKAGLWLWILFCLSFEHIHAEENLTLDPPPGSYHQPLYIKVTSALDGRLYYSTADTILRDENHLYKGVVKLENAGKHALKFLREDLLGHDTKYGPYIYNVIPHDSQKSEMPTVRPAGATYEKAQKLEFVNPSKLSILYRLGDSLDLKLLGSEDVMIDHNTTLYYRVEYPGGKRSDIVSEKYTIVLGQPKVSIETKERSFKTEPTLELKLENAVRAYYSLDPFAPQTAFEPAGEAITLPEGKHQLRVVAVNEAGKYSEIVTYQITVDKTPPHTRYVVDLDKKEVRLFSSETGAIFYTTDGSSPDLGSTRYASSLPLQKDGVILVRFFAIDTMGNSSPIRAFTASSDTTGPLVTVEPKGGAFKNQVTVKYRCNEPCIFRYSLDGSAPVGSPRKITGQESAFTIKDDGVYRLRYIARDLAGNPSVEGESDIVIDSKPPTVSYRVRRLPEGPFYQLVIETNEQSTIYTSTSGKASKSSTVWQTTQKYSAGQRVSLIAVDSLGNSSEPIEIEEIVNPKVIFNPPGGMYKHTLSVQLSTSTAGKLMYQLETPKDKSPKNNIYRAYTSPISLDYPGYFTLRTKVENGSVGGVIEEQAFVIDPYPPRIVPVLLSESNAKQIKMKFETDESVRIYYTTNGTTPDTSSQFVGDPYRDEPLLITIDRAERVVLKYQGIDRAGNRTSIYDLDLLAPSVRTSPPPGAYQEILRVELLSQQGHVIYFSWDSASLSQKSPVYRTPLVVQRTDTVWFMAVDPTGFAGPKQKAIYTLDLPPEPNFSVFPDPLYIGQKALFDASLSADEETPPGGLSYRWDFDGDGQFDVPFSQQTQQYYTYTSARQFPVVLEVRDSKGQVERQMRNMSVRRPCPPDMAMIILPQESFCIDQYEWPNQQGVKPLTGVNFAEAASYCREKGRYLCKAEQWEASCKGPWGLAYAYANQYRPEMCAVSEKEPVASGKKQGCRNDWNVYDMVGNVWEWVDGYSDSHYMLMGGGFNQARAAGCGLTFPGLIESKAEDIGFRCCM